MNSFCNFCAKKCKTIRIYEAKFTCDGQTVTTKDVLKMLPNDIVALLDTTTSICCGCLKQLQDFYTFMEQVKKSAALLKCPSEGQRTEIRKEGRSGNQTTVKTKLSEEGKETIFDDSYKSCFSFRPIQPKTPNIKQPGKTVNISCTSAVTSRLYKCLECGETFRSFKHLREHESESGLCSTNINDVFVCKFCHLCFKDADNLNKHQSHQHPEQQFLCCLCKDKVFNSKGYLARHIDKIHQHSSLQYFCGECEEIIMLSSQEEVSKHFSDVSHCELVGCDVKNNTNANAKSQESLSDEDMDLEMHEEFLDEFLLAHTTNENSFQFSECWEALDLHLNDMLHGNSTNFPSNEEHSEAFPCPQCFERFINPQPLLKHLAEKHDMPVLICRTCRQAFSSINNFKLHKSIKCATKQSATDKSIACPYNCNKTFTSTLNLKQHLRIVHTQNKKHICQLCDKQFSTLDHLKKHVLSQHQNERKHICHICSKSFTQMCHLKEHMAIHTTGKPVQCTECPQRFWRKVDMQRHRKKQHIGL